MEIVSFEYTQNGTIRSMYLSSRSLHFNNYKAGTVTRLNLRVHRLIWSPGCEHFTHFIIAFYHNINSFYRIFMSFYRIIMSFYRFIILIYRIIISIYRYN